MSNEDLLLTVNVLHYPIFQGYPWEDPPVENTNVLMLAMLTIRNVIDKKNLPVEMLENEKYANIMY